MLERDGSVEGLPIAPSMGPALDSVLPARQGPSVDARTAYVVALSVGIALAAAIVAQVLTGLLADERRGLPGDLQVPHYRREGIPQSSFLVVGQLSWMLHELPGAHVLLESLIADPGAHPLMKCAELLFPVRITLPDHDHLAVIRPAFKALDATILAVSAHASESRNQPRRGAMHGPQAPGSPGPQR